MNILCIYNDNCSQNSRTENSIDDDANNDNKPISIQAAQCHINAILAGCNTTSSIKKSTDCAKRKYHKFFLAFLSIPIVNYPKKSLFYIYLHKEG